MPCGVLLLGMGGPESLDEVRPFLRALFQDNDIVPLPFGPRVQRAFGWLVSALRAPKAKRFYAALGGLSPQRRTSEAQARALSRRLDLEASTCAPWRSYLAFRYARPLTDEALEAARLDGVNRLFVLPLYPQYSMVTTGSSLRELDRGFRRIGWRPREVVTIRDYCDDERYVAALATSVARTLGELGPRDRAEALLLFSAHALPMRVVRRGDPYPEQVEATIRAVVARLGEAAPPHVLCYQSQARPFVRWIGPRTDETIERLAREGSKVMVVVPVSFVAEHVETLYEIDVLYAELARKSGVRVFRRTPALGEDTQFVGALAAIVLRAAGLEPHAAPEQVRGAEKP